MATNGIFDCKKAKQNIKSGMKDWTTIKTSITPEGVGETPEDREEFSKMRRKLKK